MKRLKLFRKLCGGFIVIGLPAFAQIPFAPGDLENKLAQVEKQLDSLDLSIPAAALAQAESMLAQVRVQVPPAPPAPPAPAVPDGPFRGRGSSKLRTNNGAYDAGTRALDDHKYDQAIQDFDRVIAAKSDRADGALYWKAYALNRLGRREDAIAAIAQLRRDYPNSRWLNDAQALEVEARQRAGQPVSPSDEANDDLKLMAINGLMNADPDRAVPLLEGLLKGSAPPNVKDRAMFVLTQSRAPRAQQVIVDFAKGSSNPDLQIRAIRYLGMAGAQNADQLTSIYSATSDAEVKSAILRALLSEGASAKLLDLAKSEKDPKMRVEAIRYFYSGGAQLGTLTSLYASETDPEVKKEIVRGLMSRGDAKDLVDLARKENDPTMKRTIVQYLSSMRNNKDATDYMLELLK
jgi:tetratricopeptide (TPR) repeat protein